MVFPRRAQSLGRTSPQERESACVAGLGDALWAAHEDDVPGARSALSVYLGVTAAIALLLVLRRPDGMTNPQFWAEDGTVFFQQNLELGCWRALQTFFHGFPYLGQRLVACAATPVPFAHVPRVYSLVAYVVAAASLASFSLPGFRHVIRNDALRIFFCFAVAALPQLAGLPGSLTNTSWFLGLWLVLLTVMRLPTSAKVLGALFIPSLLATFSAPLSTVAAPLWFARGLHALRRRRGREAFFAALALCAVVALTALAGDLGRDHAARSQFLRPLIDSLAVLFAYAALGPQVVLSLVAHFGVSVAYAIALAMSIVLIGLAWWVQWRSLPILLYCFYGIILSSTFVLEGRPMVATNMRSFIWVSHKFLGRYHVLAVSLVYLAVLASIDRVPRQRIRSTASVAFVAWLVFVEAPTFAVPQLPDLGWPLQAAHLDRKWREKTPEPLTIPVNPDPSGLWFSIMVDHRTIAPEVNVPREEVVGVLWEGLLVQSFVARCTNLSEIDLLFGKEGQDVAQTVQVQLRDEESGHVAATFTLDAAGMIDGASEAQRVAMLEQRAAVEGRPITRQVARSLGSVDYFESLYFPPIPDSLGKRYVIEVTASGGRPHDSVTIYGSAADAYVDGEARLNGRLLPGDLAFRYGCSPE
jgi:hypothetical protein